MTPPMSKPSLHSKYLLMRPRPPLWLARLVGAKTPMAELWGDHYAGLYLLVTDLDAFDNLSEIVLDERELGRFRWQS